jgi:hypothetical protein
MSKLSSKEKLLNSFFNPVYNTITVAQAQARYGITNVSARINELRKEGVAIYTNVKTLADGRKISVYRLGKPSKRYLKLLKAGKVNEAVKSLYRRAA